MERKDRIFDSRKDADKLNIYQVFYMLINPLRNLIFLRISQIEVLNNSTAYQHSLLEPIGTRWHFFIRNIQTSTRTCAIKENKIKLFN